MVYIIYKTTNKLNGKFYIGKHQTFNPNDGYLGSGKGIRDAIKKYGRENFFKEVLFIFDTEEEMNAKEKEILTKEFVSTNENYNKGVGGEGGAQFTGRKHSEETKNRIKEKLKGSKLSDSSRKKISECNKKRKLSEETRNKLSEKTKLRFKEMTSNERAEFSNSVKSGMNILRGDAVVAEGAHNPLVGGANPPLAT